MTWFHKCLSLVSAIFFLNSGILIVITLFVIKIPILIYYEGSGIQKAMGDLRTN